MARKRIIRIAGDIREHPRYSIEEAAAYVRIPKSTLRSWVRGRMYPTTAGPRRFRPLIEPADPGNKLLSFYNLAEAHVLRATTQKNIPIENVRKALEFIRERMPSNHPLLSNDFKAFGKYLFIEHLGQPVNATRHGQVGMREVLDKYLERIERDERGMPLQIYPIETKHLAINPRISSGKPIVRSIGVAASILLDRKQAGETIPELAKDYGLTAAEVEQAIQEYAAA